MVSLPRPPKGKTPTSIDIDGSPLIKDDINYWFKNLLDDHDLTIDRLGKQYHRLIVRYKNNLLEKSQWILEKPLKQGFQNLISQYHSLQHWLHLHKLNN